MEGRGAMEVPVLMRVCIVKTRVLACAMMMWCYMWAGSFTVKCQIHASSSAWSHVVNLRVALALGSCMKQAVTCRGLP
jgi:hypothetical protein